MRYLTTTPWRLFLFASLWFFSLSLMAQSTSPYGCDQFITFSSGSDTSCYPALSTTSTTTTTTTSSTTTTTQAVSLSINLVSGWNLLGNIYAAPISPSAIFSDSGLISTVWKWQPEVFKWAVYSPSLASQGGTKLQEYANSVNSDILQSIMPGEGYWVNASKTGAVSPSSVSFAGLMPLISSSWVQVCACQLGGFSNFLDALNSHIPPNDMGKVSSVWKWNTSTSKWSYFALSAPDTSATFAAANNLNVLTDIALGEGVWVGFNNNVDQFPPSVGVLPQTQSQAPPDYSGQFVVRPSSPLGVTATGGDASALVAFNLPANNGGASISSYTVTASPGGRTATGASSPLSVTGLSNGTAYTFTVTATNSVGTSDASSASNSVTPVAPIYAPGAPTGVTATAGNASATVAFTAPANNGGASISSYTVASSGGQSASGTSSPIIVNGLTSGVQYNFTVTASNSAGTSIASSSSNTVVYYANLPIAPNVTAEAGNASAIVKITAATGACIEGRTISCYLVPAGSPTFTVTSNPGGITATSSNSPITITGLINGTSYTFTATMTTNVGTSGVSTASNAVTPSAPLTTPSAPTGVNATAGNTSALVSFSPPVNNGGAPITVYTVTSSPGGKTATGSSSPISVTGLTNGTPYTFTVTATNSAGTSSASSASNVATPVWPDVTVSLLQGWNLIGNGYEVPIEVANTLSDPTKVVTVWKWAATQTKWAFYTPSLTSQGLSTYVSNKGYDLLSEISPGEGFWVNAKTAFDLNLPTGTPTNSYDFQSEASKALTKGWSLIAIGDKKTPSEFNVALSATPPTTSSAPPNVTTLWAWDAQATNWMFFAPSLVNSGTLSSYINSKGYLGFGTKTLTPATGFWVNKP